MNLPNIGELRHRVTIRRVTKVPTGTTKSSDSVTTDTVWGKLDVIGSGLYWDSKQIDETVTHRIYLRTISGRTRPQDLVKVTEFVVDGILYKAKRIADIGGANRFTVIDCQEKGVFNAD